MNTNLCKITAIILVVVLLAGCGTLTGTETSLVVRSAEDVQRITPTEAKPLVDDGQAILYDVRSADSYRDQHATGAISFPENDAPARYSELANDKTLIFY